MKPRRYWTELEMQQLCELYPILPASTVAERIGRDVRAVYQKAAALGLGKSEAFFASDLSGRIQRGRTDPRMVATQLKPGNVPWNKGKHFVSGGRSVETRFKPHPPEESRNYKPIGSLRMSKDGYLERKVTDDRRLVPTRRWTAVHRLVWEQHVGPIPAGHVVVFRAGCRTAVLDEITPDRLECITRAELQRRNSIHIRLPPDVRRLAQIKGAITRQVNRIIKENKS